MNKFLSTGIAIIIFTLVLGICTTSCNKEFDRPPLYEPPAVAANTTIKALKALLLSSGDVTTVADDLIIRGVIIGDDKSGNLYQSIVIQDGTSGILIRMNGIEMYTSYPIGQEVFVKCKGLVLGDYNGLVQLGVMNATGDGVERIPSALFDTYIVKGTANNTVTPKEVTVANLSTDIHDTLQNTLIKLDGFEFAAADTSKIYAQPATVSSGTNFTLKNCSSNSITLRTSAYADFAPANVPNGNGAITAIYTVFGNTKQLTIRDTNDVQFTAARCTTGGGGTGGGTTVFSEDFGSITNNAVLNLTGWQNIGETGGKQFTGKTFGTPTSTVGFISAFGSGQATVTSWLITPAINLTGAVNPVLTFKTSDAFDNGATLKVYISNDYNGSATPSTATWTLLPATISSGHTTGTYGPFITSGNLSLSAYTGNVYIAFKYEGADPSGTGDKTTNFEIDTILIKKD